MAVATGELTRRPTSRSGRLFPILLGAVGLLMAHHPMILSAFRAVQTDPVDSRLINYILEHSYLWAGGVPDHDAFWSPPFYYPARNVGAYSDVLLTVAPLYWTLRASGLTPDSAFQGWMLAISALNYGSAIVLFRRGFGFERAAATLGAFLVAFGAPRINQLGHQQLLSVFYALIAVFAMTRVFVSPRPSRPIRWAWWQVAALSVAGQLYAGFYNGWFLILAFGFCACWAVALPSTRGPFLRTLWADGPAIGAALVVGCLVSTPFLSHYLAAARELGFRNFRFVRYSIPRPWSWLYVGPAHWIWGWSAGLDQFRSLPMPTEQRVGFGLITPLACIMGFVVGRHRPLVRIAALAALTWVLVATELPGELIADIGLGLVLIVAARFYHDRSQPGSALVAFGALVGFAACDRFPSWRMLGLILIVMALCLAECWRGRHRPAGWLVPAALILWSCGKLFDPTCMGIVLALVVPVVAIVERLGRWDRAAVRFAGMGGWLLGVTIITYLDRPRAFGVLIAAPLMLRAGVLGRWPGVGHRPLAILMVVALGAMLLLESENALWHYIYEWVPGGSAIRAVGRAGLVVLFLAAVGLAALFAAPWASRRPWLAGLLGSFCILEQGLTTSSFDKLEARERVEKLARRVDRSALAFYYRPSRPVLFEYHLDAMWMSLRSGVPTVNGYSGGDPPGWAPLLQMDFRSRVGPREALSSWLDRNHLRLEQVQTIGIDDERTAQPGSNSPRAGGPSLSQE